MQEDYGGVTFGGNVFFLFRKKERTKEKSIAFGLFARLEYYARYRGTAFFIREAARMGGFDRLTCYESAACVGGYYSQLPRFYFFFVSGYRESGLLI